MKTQYPSNDNGSTKFTDDIWTAASKVADRLDPDGDREIISFEPAVEAALEEHAAAGNATAPMAAIVNRAIELEHEWAAEDALLQKILKDKLGIVHPFERCTDSLDFHDLHINNIRAALEAAYEAGRQAR